MVIADGSLVSGVISGGSSLAYDAAGNRKTATKAGVTETYNYDADNQVTTVLRGGSAIGFRWVSVGFGDSLLYRRRPVFHAAQPWE